MLINKAFSSYQSSFVSLNDYKKSLNVLDYLIEVSEIMEYDNWLDYAYFKKAETKFILKDYLGAIQDISEIIKKYPEDWMNWDLRAKIKLEYTAIDSACEDYKEALRLIELNYADNSEDIDLLKKIIKDNCN
ncbi:hypothetical protein N8376_03500 [Flavobacteriaceae bacterium]|nr:hypothetical protein [Flavobacteriaceae bacterium]MDC1492403.1 hypothetical protein [Flavobacteriaceae bacterium]